jgi:hypothetical protein
MNLRCLSFVDDKEYHALPREQTKEQPKLASKKEL